MLHVGTREVLMTPYRISGARGERGSQGTHPPDRGVEQGHSRPGQVRADLLDQLFHQNFQVSQADQKLTGKDPCHGHSVGQWTYEQ